VRACGINRVVSRGRKGPAGWGGTISSSGAAIPAQTGPRLSAWRGARGQCGDFATARLRSRTPGAEASLPIAIHPIRGRAFNTRRHAALMVQIPGLSSLLSLPCTPWCGRRMHGVSIVFPAPARPSCVRAPSPTRHDAAALLLLRHAIGHKRRCRVAPSRQCESRTARYTVSDDDDDDDGRLDSSA
jgi:hypothetical protein